MEFFSKLLFTLTLHIHFLHTKSCPSNIFEQQYPQFQIVAAAKTGSTSLYSYLCQHASIACLAKKKELNLLRSPRSYRDREEKKRALAEYLRRGFNVNDSIHRPFVTFEASIHYYHHETALKNLNALLPCSRLVWILRNPLPRAISEYLHQAVKSKDYPSFNSLIQAEIKAIQKCRKRKDVYIKDGFKSSLFKCLATFKLKKYMLSTAFYGFFIAAWLEMFPRKQHLFLDYEKFRLNPDETVKKISNFLGLEAHAQLNRTWKYNKANTRDGIAAQKRKQIRISSSFMNSLVKEVSLFIAPMYEIIGEDFQWKLDSLT